MENFLIPVKLLLLGKIKAFLLVWLISFINVGQNQYVFERKQIYSFGAYYKIKHVGDLYIHYYNEIFEEMYELKFTVYIQSIFRRYILSSSWFWEYRKKNPDFTIKYGNALNSTVFILWSLSVKLSLFLSCGNYNMVKTVRIWT